MQRWTARLLLLVMLVPAVGPVALARVAPAEGMHCMRRPLPEAPEAQPVMHCHHAAAQSAARQDTAPQGSGSADASVRSLDCCCNHDCCGRTVKTSEWAQPAANHLSFVSLLIEPSRPAHIDTRASATLAGPDSARAPPRP
ncbi:MAG: hypothetical protein ABSG70_14385 [Terriglobales bacterium]